VQLLSTCLERNLCLSKMSQWTLVPQNSSFCSEQFRKPFPCWKSASGLHSAHPTVSPPPSKPRKNVQDSRACIHQTLYREPAEIVSFMTSGTYPSRHWQHKYRAVRLRRVRYLPYCKGRDGLPKTTSIPKDLQTSIFAKRCIVLSRPWPSRDKIVSTAALGVSLL
jgi:hypothetical protein